MPYGSHNEYIAMRKCLYKNSEELKLNYLKTETPHGEVAVFKNIPKIQAVPMKTKQKKQRVALFSRTMGRDDLDHDK